VPTLAPPDVEVPPDRRQSTICLTGEDGVYPGAAAIGEQTGRRQAASQSHVSIAAGGSLGTGDTADSGTLARRRRHLGRYTHRVGLSNRRLVSMNETDVTFRTKDGKSVSLPGETFLARFLQHVLPPGFVKIRHYGLHAASHATTRLEIARQRLAPAPVALAGDRGEQPSPSEDWRPLMLQLSGIDVRVCPACNQPTLERCALPDPRGRAPPMPA
jgi:hypothetical protein